MVVVLPSLNQKIKIEFENSIIDQKNLTIKAFGDVKVYKVDKKSLSKLIR